MKATERSMTTLSMTSTSPKEWIPLLTNGTAPEFTGTIRFSGAEADKLITQAAGETEADWQNRLAESKYFNVSGKTTLYDGTLILEDGVTYGNKDLTKDSSFTVNKGVLEITGNSSVNSRNITIESGVTLRTGRGAALPCGHDRHQQGRHL